MDFNEYQRKTDKTAVYPQETLLDAVLYTTLGLAGEAGEVANKVKKILRDYDGEITDTTREIVASEIGDVLWYCAQLAGQLNISLDEIAHENLEKLSKRQNNGTIKGNGDKR